MAGIALILLGAVNRVVGLGKTEESNRMIVQASHAGTGSDYLSFDELDAGADGAVLRPLIQEEERVSYATARMDFYHAAFLTGQVMAVAGVVLTLFGFIVIIQRDTRRTLRRFSEAPGEPGAEPQPPKG